MKKVIIASIISACLFVFATPKSENAGKWISLFDGKTFNGWKVGANAGTFTIKDGMIIANGDVAHLFYVGDVKNHEFKDFEFKQM